LSASLFGRFNTREGDLVSIEKKAGFAFEEREKYPAPTRI